MTDRIGQQLGNYHLINLLGDGGFAEVYLGKHIHLDTLAAVKILHTQLSRNDGDRFRTEARTIAHLAHPHIVRVMDYGIDDATPFLVMDYASNGTLRQQHPQGTTLAPQLVAHYILQIAAALQYAHDHKIIHRDIKPENMLVGNQYEILLSDFGIAVTSQSSRSRSIDEIAGTISYMAPEQIRYHPRPASDQYALGIVVYEWLSGDRPFVGNFFEIASQHITTPPPSLCNKVPGLSPVLEKVVFTALHKDPAQRFSDVQTFAQTFAQVCQGIHPTALSRLSSLPVLSAPSSNHAQSAPGTQGTRQREVVRRVTLVSQDAQPVQVNTPVTPSALVQIKAPVDTPPALPVAHKAPQTQAKHLSRRSLLAGITGIVAIGATATWFASTHKEMFSSLFTSTTPTSGTPHVLGDHPFTYTGHSDMITSLSWSQDGKRVASGSFDTTVQVWDATTGNNLLSYQGHANKVTTVAYSFDGMHIASGSVDTTVQVWDAMTGALLLTYDAHKNPVRSVSWSTRPINTYIASAGNDGIVHVWNAATRATQCIYKGHTQAINEVSWSTDGSHIASASADHTVQIWNPSTGAHVLSYQGHTQEVFSVQWAPDSDFIASGSADNSVHVWNSASGGLIFAYKGHTATINKLVWSPDSKYIASASNDGTVHVWNAFTGENLLVYRGHSNGVSAVAWSPDNTHIASGGDDTTVQVW